MQDSYRELQDRYIDALRGVMPDIVGWWKRNCPYGWTEPIPPEAMNDFHRRWPVGPAAHPRIIAIFREYYFAVQDLNQDSPRGKEPVEDEALWGKDAAPGSVPYARPIDLLVNDLEFAAPDLFEVMQGFVFVPVGMTLDGQEC